MAEKLFQKRSLDKEDLVESSRQYLAMHKDLALDYAVHMEYIFADLVLFSRSDIQSALDNNHNFSPEMLSLLKKADQYLLDNVDVVAEWIRNMIGQPEEPRSHWWWYLDLIADEVMDAPDLDEIYSSLIEKAEMKAARAF